MLPRRTLLVLAALSLSACTAPRSAPGTAEFVVLPHEHAAAHELRAELRALLADRPGVRVEADPRTNSLLVMGGPEDVERVRDLVQSLDRAVPEG